MNLLLLPGLLCDAVVWREQVAGLPQLNCQSADYGVADSIAAMAERALAAAPERFALAGHSMGGRVALEIYRRVPERVSHLILLDTGFEPRAAGEPGAAEERKRLALLEQAQREGMRAMGHTWLQGMVHPQRLEDGPLMEELLQMVERKTPEIFAAQIKALLARPDGGEVLGTINCPTLLICGRQDAWSPLARHEEMAQLIGGSDLIAIEECGHMSTLERPVAVTQAIGHWLGVL